MAVALPAHAGRRASAAARPVAHLRKTSAGLLADGPERARTPGRIMVLLSHARHSSSYGPIYVYKHALHPPVTKPHAAAGAGRRRERLGRSTARACGSGT